MIRRWLGAIAGLLFSFSAHAELITVTPSSGGGGSFPPAGCSTTNGVIYNNATPCGASLTFTPSTGQLLVDSGVALAAVTGLLVNPVSASGLLADFQVGGASVANINSTGSITSAAGIITSSVKGVNVTQTWNASGTVFDAPLVVNVTPTAFATTGLGSRLFDFQQGSGPSSVIAGVLGTSNVGALQVFHDYSSAGAVYSDIELGFRLHSGVAAIDVAAATSTLPNFGIYVGGSNKLDYGIGAISQWSFSSLVNLNAAAAVTGTLVITGGVQASTSVSVGNGSQFYWSTQTTLASPADGQFKVANSAGTNSFILTAVGATATPQVQFGAANVNGSPVAQTVSFQGALAGSASNQASATTTIVGSLGTGTGTNGDIVFQTGAKTTTGSVQATATTALTLKGETQAVLTGGTLTVGVVNSATGLFVCETAGLLSSGITTCVASDRSVKHNIAAIDDADLLDKVLSQRGVRFDYDKDKGAPGHRIGVVANDWESNFPELVDYDSAGIRHFDYAATWGLSVEMFRRLRVDNDNLRAKFEALEQRIAR